MHYIKLPFSVQIALIVDALRCKSPRYRILVNADSVPISIRTDVAKTEHFESHKVCRWVYTRSSFLRSSLFFSCSLEDLEEHQQLVARAKRAVEARGFLD
ncbi:hypothetical protein HPB51_013900 [Rhipicephalus microplus]|uniref:Uncharacterized protein n=1 Tax=Rhipicephalus microplus TaxID=6941 RepID=A0A9J6D4X7_RHIMP|nr:hypothetical protein HPB51_013900 [Rhipicephalus microplus]